MNLYKPYHFQSNSDEWKRCNVYDSKGYYSSDPKTIEKLDDLLQLDLEIHEHNKTVFAEQKLIMQSIIQQMLDLGFPKSYTSNVNPDTGRKTKQRYNHKSKWLEGIEEAFMSLVPKYFDVSSQKLTRAYMDMKDEIKKRIEVNEKKQQEQKEQSAKADRNRQQLVLTIKLALKYGQPDFISYDGMLDYLLKQNKYLKLADAMERTRGNWSDGPWLVEQALENFSTDTPLDQSIWADVKACCDNDDGYFDGRVFRDTEYNYGVLYSYVPEELLKDYQAMMGFYND